MSVDDTEKHAAWLADELHNFEEIARYLTPPPGNTPRLEGIEISSLSMPLNGPIGGDHTVFIDFNRRYDLPARIARAERKQRHKVAAKLRENERRAGILVADVSGHRITDAMLAAMLHQAFLMGAYYELDRYGEITTRIFEHLNSRFYRTTAVNKYFTMIYGEITDEGRFRFLSAGHQPPAVFSCEFGKFMKISADRMASFPPVGMIPSNLDQEERVEEPSPFGYKERYEINEINLLGRGDILLLHTDGLSDHDEGRFFPGEVEKLLADCRNSSADEIIGRVRDAILARAEPEDDITVVAIRKTS